MARRGSTKPMVSAPRMDAASRSTTSLRFSTLPAVNRSTSWPETAWTDIAEALDILLTPDALDHQISRDVDDERHQHQQRADDEQRLIVLAALDRLAQLRRDRGRQRPYRIEQAGRDLDRVTGGHQDGHGFADRAADSEQGRRQQAVLGGWYQHLVDQLPAARAERKSGLAVGVRHRAERILPHRHDDRHAHEGQDHAAVQDVDPDRSPGGPDDQRVQHHVAYEPPDDRRDGGQQLDYDFQRLSQAGRAELGDEHRRSEAGGHRQYRRQQRHRCRPGDERQRAVLGPDAGIGPPVDAGEELPEVEFPEKERRTFPKDEEEDGEDKKNGAPATQPDHPLDQRFGD